MDLESRVGPGLVVSCRGRGGHEWMGVASERTITVARQSRMVRRTKTPPAIRRSQLFVAHREPSSSRGPHTYRQTSGSPCIHRPKVLRGLSVSQIQASTARHTARDRQVPESENTKRASGGQHYSGMSAWEHENKFLVLFVAGVPLRRCLESRGRGMRAARDARVDKTLQRRESTEVFFFLIFFHSISYQRAHMSLSSITQYLKRLLKV